MQHSQLSCIVGESSGNHHGPLHLPDIKFFPHVYTLLKVLRILPVMKVENERYENGRKRLKAHPRNTLTGQRSSSLALLNMHFDVKHDLDLTVDTYIKVYTTKSELPTDNSESVGNTRGTFKMRSLLYLILKKNLRNLKGNREKL